MSDPLPLPADLLHLMEKRNQAERRQKHRREEEVDVPTESERRNGADRREELRRQSDDSAS